ncbi:UDP-2,4-diacetamido-2,4,6-trideoxy-beta-L-altropyranose hydrolase [Methylomonas methanica]|uniref:Pseudaminic acid biosynthesis-associated protein PseG n=1 Tax=Methylomonas methanica (strain DSM 25384 / MC09) TaxID=857087 RepID=F9ZZF4_METMM|nr:UDP-2,4-diacetamido-2,4,6-trideoxy-beta-L-altropyranose hydrolase [Methylomonas methanica]AEG02347.1 pseudaminic acid biosynthesis-associated protein PseG [Methylomonas methanica MC09]
MIVFRCNASPTVGLGHLVRCRALAQALAEQGESCVMVGPPKSYATAQDAELFQDWIDVDEWISSEGDAARLAKIAGNQSARFAVLDDYRIDASYQKFLLAEGLHWLQFDGTAKKPLWADWVVNANPAARADDYRDVLHNPTAELLLGPAYAVLRAEFSLAGSSRPAGRSIEQVLITFGGGDDRGGIEFALSSLIENTPVNWRFVVISGGQNPRNPQLLAWVATLGQGRVSLLINPDNVAAIMAGCDLAVMAGGTSIYEAASCRLPMVIIPIADNQVQPAKAWANAGAALFPGGLPDVNAEQLISAVSKLAADDVFRRDMALKAGDLVDGKGAQRLAGKIIETAGTL